MKLAKNAFCHCGSGKRYRDCCLQTETNKWRYFLIGTGAIVGIAWLIISAFLVQTLFNAIDYGALCVPIRGTQLQSCDSIFAVFKLIALTITNVLLGFTFLKIWGRTRT